MLSLRLGFLMLSFWFRLRGLLEVTTYELSPLECHLNDGLLKGDTGLLLRCFCWYKSQNLTNICAGYIFYCLESLQVYFKFFLLSLGL
jgi:hypothetical protein